ncbi:MAG: aminotransferase class I/II-fold pyridoxal phosphate-dependent enzyme [Ignavibacteriales bacterium]|nr:aminotransferase class I/II-fold pyridoxal phosphate-dependent enzyme [Ignavibacteriales bacterium]
MRTTKKEPKTYSTETELIYGKTVSKKWDFNHHVVPPISSSSTFRLDSAKRGAQGFAEFAHHAEGVTIESCAPIYVYDRLGEPNKEMLEENLATAERGEMAVTFSTGMAAVSAALGSLTGMGDEIIAHNIIYGCTYSLLTNWYPRYKITTQFVDMKELSSVKKAITPRTRVIYFESPVNPTLELIDISAISEIVKEINKQRTPERKIYVVIDNTFASPYCQRPLELGADFVLASLTKGICGFGTDMGGVVVGPRWSYDIIMLYRKDFGGALAAKSAWPILVYGLPSLPTRMRQQMSTAMEVATFLENDSRISYVSYPGLKSFPQYELAQKQMRDYDGNFAPGSILFFSLKGKTPKIRRDRGEKVINSLAKKAYTITLAVSLGHIRTLVEHPSSMTHSAIPLAEQIKKGIDPGGIRLSIGLEKPRDIIRDLSEALKIL